MRSSAQVFRLASLARAPGLNQLIEWLVSTRKEPRLLSR